MSLCSQVVRNGRREVCVLNVGATQLFLKNVLNELNETFRGVDANVAREIAEKVFDCINLENQDDIVDFSVVIVACVDGMYLTLKKWLGDPVKAYVVASNILADSDVFWTIPKLGTSVDVGTEVYLSIKAFFGEKVEDVKSKIEEVVREVAEKYRISSDVMVKVLVKTYSGVLYTAMEIIDADRAHVLALTKYLIIKLAVEDGILIKIEMNWNPINLYS